MSEETQQTQTDAAQTQAAAKSGQEPQTRVAQAAAQTQATAPTAQADEKTVPYARFQEVINARNELATQRTDLAAQLKQLQDAQVESEKAHGELRAQFEQTQKDLDSERLARLRVETAARKGLPLDLAGRLSGANAEELEADAETLLQFVKKAMPATPGTPPPARGNGSASKLDLKSMTPAEIRSKRDEILRG